MSIPFDPTLAREQAVQALAERLETWLRSPGLFPNPVDLELDRLHRALGKLAPRPTDDPPLRGLRFGVPRSPIAAPSSPASGPRATRPGSAARVIEIARAQIGTVERPTNRTPYGAWFGMDGQPWCAMFVAWVLAEAGVERFLQPNRAWAWTPRIPGFFQAGILGSWHTQNPLPGDVVVYSFARKDERGRRLPDHVGLVESIAEDGYLVAIEGNTSSGNGDQRNGGEVARKRRSPALVLGYGRPFYRA